MTNRPRADAVSRDGLPLIVLAAGAATRMGRLKQLIPFAGETLLRHSIRQVQEAGFGPVFVVLGAEADAVRSSLIGLPLEFVFNPEWAAGMGSSLNAGMQAVLANAESPPGIAVVLGDQPLVTAIHLRQIQDAFWSGGTQTVAAEYGGRLGVPAVFQPAWFPALTRLAPEAGAGKLLNSGRPVRRFLLPEAAFDIDTPQDLEALGSL